MKQLFRQFLALLLCLGMLVSALPSAHAEESETIQQEAEDISSDELVKEQTGFRQIHYLFNGNLLDGIPTPGCASLTLENSRGIGSLYFIFGIEYGNYTVTDTTTGESHTFGQQGFLHDFLDLEGAFGYVPTCVQVDFANGPVNIFELFAFTPGETPDFVQKWSEPAEDKTDLILFSTHGDDEQLFFAGILPYYAGHLKYQVQVVYLTNHRNRTLVRAHEMLNGLWAVGVRTYPVFGPYPDFRRNTLAETYADFQNLGWSREHMLGFVVEQLRRFNPLVVVGHDFNGEYRHGQHMVYTDLLVDALEISNDPSQYPELAEKYGVWDVPKAYIHLYKQNEILMDWDQPLDSFDGMTAFEVTKYKGFPCHVSQQEDFGFWINYPTAAALPEHDPRAYGLYRSTVGEDVEKNDFFENLTTYAEQDRLAQEAQRQEEEQQEEERRQAEADRLAAEEADRLATEEETTQQETEPLAPPPPDDSHSWIAILCLTAGGAMILSVSAYLIFKKVRRP